MSPKNIEQSVAKLLFPWIMLPPVDHRRIIGGAGPNIVHNLFFQPVFSLDNLSLNAPTRNGLISIDILNFMK
jgi:hypothetical protein